MAWFESWLSLSSACDFDQFDPKIFLKLEKFQSRDADAVRYSCKFLGDTDALNK